MTEKLESETDRQFQDTEATVLRRVVDIIERNTEVMNVTKEAIRAQSVTMAAMARVLSDIEAEVRGKG